MAKSKKSEVSTATPSQEDEADIVAEIGAVPTDDGELEADPDKVREAGAVDAESIRENRRVEEMVNKKRSGQPGVPFNLDNLLEKYEGIIKFWPANTIDILVKRVTGTPIQWVIQSRPRSGAELYQAILSRHGRYEEAEYDVRLFDCNDKQRRGTGRIVMPDTRETPPMPQPQPGVYPMNPQPPQPQQSVYPMNPQPPPAMPATTPSSADPVAMMRAVFEMFQQMNRPASAVQPASSAQPVLSTQPAPTQPSDPMAMMKSMFELFQQMRPSTDQPAPPSSDPMAMMKAAFEMFQQMQPSSSPSSPSDPTAMMRSMFELFQKPASPPPAAPAPPSSSTDPMAMMKAAFEMFQKMQPQQPAAQQPPVQTPPGMFFVPGFGFVPADRLLAAVSGQPVGPGLGSHRASMYGGGAPPSSYGEPRPYGESRPPYTPPGRPKSASEEFRDAVAVVETAVSIAERFRGGAQTAPPAQESREDDDNPVKVMDVGGGWPVVIDKRDGSARLWETGVANVGNVLKWIAEQREAIQKASAERNAKPERQELPPGYVEVTPGYKPPPGYVAVPVDHLPPPPREMPAPITQQEEPPKQRAWGAPPMPEAG
jgi:hypothetical protein